jgi:uncharacterized protein YbaR (Trm112 family)
MPGGIFIPVKSIHGLCDSCGSHTSIHLVVQKKGKKELAELFCSECLDKFNISDDSPVIEIDPARKS